MIYDVFVLFRGGSVVFISSIAGYQPMQVMIITMENNTPSYVYTILSNGWLSFISASACE